MHQFEYIVIIIFSVGMLIEGLSFSSAGKNMKSFFAAGGAVPWWISEQHKEDGRGNYKLDTSSYLINY